MMAAGVFGAGIFVLYERARDRRGLSQLLPASLLANGNFALGGAMVLVFFSGAMSLFLFIAIFLQQGFAFTPLQAGLTTVPFPLGVLLVSMLNGRIGSRWHRQRIATGSLILFVGMAWLRAVVLGVADEVDHWTLFAPLLISGFGMGFAIAPLMQTALAGVQVRDAGSGAGSLQSFQQLGSAFGIAIAGQIFFSSLTGSLSSGSAPHPAFVGALSASLIYSLSTFAVVAALVVFLKPPAGHAASPETQPQPVPVEV